MQPRHDMYRNVHKGLRRTLCALVVDAGAADATPAALDEIAARWLSISALLDAHHHHEDAHIGPHLARLAPALRAEMEAEHQALAGVQLALDQAARALRDDGDLGVRALAFHRSVAHFVGRYLSHMAEEEGPYLRALQAAYDDATLAGIEGALVASIAPPVMGAFLAQMLPALTAAERLELLTDMREHAPPEAFAGALALAAQVLDARAHRALSHALAAPREVARA
ncbi:MAG: hemerythrin domain-containing protein [Polyangiales bacterium]